MVPLTLSTLIQVIGPWIITFYFEYKTGFTLGYWEFGFFNFYVPYGYLLNIISTLFEPVIIISILSSFAVEALLYLIPSRGNYLPCEIIALFQLIVFDIPTNLGLISSEAGVFRNRHGEIINQGDLYDDCRWYIDIHLGDLFPYLN